MEQKKLEQLEGERIQVIVDRLRDLAIAISLSSDSSSSLRWQAHGPSLPDIAMFPVVRDIMELPSEEKVTPRMVQSIINALPGLVSRWHKEAKIQTGKTLRKFFQQMKLNESKDAEFELDLKDLADSEIPDLAIFTYNGSASFGAPTFLTYLECLGSSWSRHHELRYIHNPKMDADPYKRAVIALTNLRPWSADLVIYQNMDDMRGPVRTMAELCGLDWKRVTWMEMDQRPERFLCVCRGCLSKPKMVMNWRAVVSASGNR